MRCNPQPNAHRLRCHGDPNGDAVCGDAGAGSPHRALSPGLPRCPLRPPPLPAAAAAHLKREPLYATAPSCLVGHQHSPVLLFTSTLLSFLFTSTLLSCCSQALSCLNVHQHSPALLFTSTLLSCCSPAPPCLVVHQHSPVLLFTSTLLAGAKLAKLAKFGFCPLADCQ
jgi:hypothetical protein